MQDIMVIEDDKMIFYSFSIDDKNSLDFSNIIKNDLISLYEYYLILINGNGYYDKQVLIENYINSLKINIEYSISFKKTLEEYYNNQASKHMVEIINEGLANKKIFDYFFNNDILKKGVQKKIKVKSGD